MSQEKEQEIRLQFLAEAEDYLATIESGLLSLGSDRAFFVSPEQALPRADRQLEPSQIDAMLRAAHSLKGGAGMMGYHTLSDLSHRLEDIFKILKARKDAISVESEQLLLAGVDGLRQVIVWHRQGKLIEEYWIETQINPPFEQLHQQLGDSNPEDHLALLSEDTEENLSVLLFQTEVESCLQRLETVLQNPEHPCLREEFLLVSQELGGLGEMLELSAFTSLCVDLGNYLETGAEEAIPAIAKTALEQWRRSQALVLVGQEFALPSQLEIEHSLEVASIEKERDISPDFLEPILSAKTELDLAPTPVIPAKTELDLPPTQSDNTIRISVRQLEELNELFGELTIERSELNLQLGNLRNLSQLLALRLKILEKSNLTLRNAYDQNNKLFLPRMETERQNLTTSLAISPSLGVNVTPLRPYFDRLEMDDYSHIHPLFQELMETIVQIEEVSADLELNLDNTQRTALDLTRTSQMLQNKLTQVRMRPLSDVTGRFPRALRDLSLKYGKPVELKITGGATLIDRTVLAALSDPLLQIIRNAFAHGIEPPDTRSAKGKPAQGLIELHAAYRGNQTVITIGDDGGGIDLEKIRAKALKQGLDADSLAQASETELLDLIFEPGFTTAEQLTDLSGRGVGMDIVRTNLQEVRGEIHVETKPNLGTIFTIKVPFTLSVVRVLLLESAGMLLALPTNSVEEMLIPSAEKISSNNGQEMLEWEGKKIPLIRLRQWLHFSRSLPRSYLNESPIINQPTVFIIAQGATAIGVEVDRYWGEQEVTTRTIEGNLSLPPGLTGCTIVGHGRIVPFIDAPALLNWIEEKRANLSEFNSLPELKRKTRLTQQSEYKPTVMVVDDSINVRRFLALTLEKAGYRVQQAKDGQDALEQLEEGLSISGMICDIEMPRLDGYGLLAQVKSNPKYKEIPMIMLTSRSGEKHRQLAMNLGANAYFSKPFQEQELLQSLKSFT